MLIRSGVYLITLLLTIIAFPAAYALDDDPTTLNVWPGEVPGETADVGPEQLQPAEEGRAPFKRIANVSQPTLTIYQAAEDNNTGAAVLVCPGGGYNIVAIEHEGEEVARWLNDLGVTAAVLKYRVPRRENQAKHLAPLQDAQRAMSLLRSRASALQIDSERIGILGFSAGGHLSAAVSTNFDQRQYDAVDGVEEHSCRPNFTVLIYPAYLVEEGTMAPEIRVTAETPPAFMVHAGDDRIGPDNSITYYQALHAVGVQSELHIYPAGGHGFGLRASDHSVSSWPQLCQRWMQAQRWLPSRQ